MNENGMPSSLRWAVGLGALLIAMGIIAIALPVAATLEAAWLMGVILVVSGIAQLAHSFRFERARSGTFRVLMGGISIVAGILTLRNPIAGALVITIVMAFYLLVVSVGRALLAFEFRQMKGRVGLVVSAVLALLLGSYLLSTLATSSLIIPGTFLGLDLIVYGVAFIALARGLKNVETKTRFDRPRIVA